MDDVVEETQLGDCWGRYNHAFRNKGCAISLVEGQVIVDSI
jgi:hypothetical protein